MPTQSLVDNRKSVGRRLFPRFQIDPFPHHFFMSSPEGGLKKIQVIIKEVAQDSLTCQTSSLANVLVGDHIFFPHPSHSHIKVNGIVASTLANNEFSRVGLSFPSIDMLRLFSYPFCIQSDQRKMQRGGRTTSKSGLRQYERRGFWAGLKSKRYFSEHAWALKNRDEYFFMKPLESGTGAHVTVGGKEMIMMSSNNYLGLSVHPRIKEAAKAAIEKYGSSPSASSLLGGTLDIHLELEEALANFKGTEAACVFSAGYTTNLSTLITILDKNDAVFFDDKNHASLMDGARLSGACGRAYRHRDVKDLENKLVRSTCANKLVVTDAVFSMDGDCAPLPDLFRACQRNKAALMVDEAHATGVFGPNGKGLLEHFGMEGKPEIVMGTLSKALSGVGGFICGSRELIQILKHTARAFVFSAAIPPSICAAILECIKIICEEPERREKLWHNTHHMREGLLSLGFNVGQSQSPIIPVIFPTEEQTNNMTRGLREEGIYVTPAIYPAVKKNATRVRTTIMATHTEQDIDNALGAFKRVKSRGI